MSTVVKQGFPKHISYTPHSSWNYIVFERNVSGTRIVASHGIVQFPKIPIEALSLVFFHYFASFLGHAVDHLLIR